MKLFAAMLLSALVLGCQGHSTHTAYKVDAAPELDRSTVDTVVRLALATPEATQYPERFDRVRVALASSTAERQEIRVELVGYMDGYLVHLTNSLAGWSVASVGRMIE